MSAIVLLCILAPGSVDIPEGDHARVEAVTKALAAWWARVSTCDVHYSLDSVITPAGVRGHPVYRAMREPVAIKEHARVARTGAKRFYSSSGQALAGEGGEGRVVDSDWECAFDGRDTTRRQGNHVVRAKGRDEARGRWQPTNLLGIDALCGNLLEHRDPTVRRVTARPKGQGKLEITLHFQLDNHPDMKHVYLVDAEKPYAVYSFKVCVGAEDAMMLQVTDVKWHRFPGDILYPVEGTRTEYDRKTGELAEQITFKVDIDRSRIDPPGGLPDSLFRVATPVNAEVHDSK